jgi:hypothetical protein
LKSINSVGIVLDGRDIGCIWYRVKPLPDTNKGSYLLDTLAPERDFNQY